MNLKALIFDVDGTLADTEEHHRLAYNEAFKDHGLDWHWSRPTYAHLLSVAGGKERLAAYINSLRLPPAEHVALSARIVDIHKSETEHYRRRVFAGQVPLREGIARLIEEAAQAGVKLAIASATMPGNVETILCGNLGADALARFAVIGAGDQVGRKKPAPDIYLWVMRELREFPDACAAVEDSSNGLKSAKSAGLFTIVTPSYWTRGEDFSAADLLLPSLGSDRHPLSSEAAAQVGNTVLGIREINQRMSSIRDVR